jgi:NitT/TauT family transport system permease protein
MTRGELVGLTAVGFGALLLVWLLAAWTGLTSPQFLPSPLEVGRTFAQLTREPFAGFTLQAHLLSSFGRFFLGFSLAVAVGIPLGLLMGWFRWIDDVVSPLFEALRFVAPLAWVPFAALWFGTGIGGPILVIFSGAFPPCVINAYRGGRFTLHHVSPDPPEEDQASGKRAGSRTFLTGSTASPSPSRAWAPSSASPLSPPKSASVKAVSGP